MVGGEGRAEGDLSVQEGSWTQIRQEGAMQFDRRET